jgi:hypothetical protein
VCADAAADDDDALPGLLRRRLLHDYCIRGKTAEVVFVLLLLLPSRGRAAEEEEEFASRLELIKAEAAQKKAAGVRRSSRK